MAITYALLAPALLLVLLCWLNRHFDAPEEQPLQVRQSAAIQHMFLWSNITFAVIALGLPLTTGETEYSPYLALLALLTALCAPVGFLSGIRYGEGGLTVRTYFGRIHFLHWEDITALTSWTEDGALFIRTARKTFWLSNNALGCPDFLTYAAEACRVYGITPSVPKSPQR